MLNLTLNPCPEQRVLISAYTQLLIVLKAIEKDYIVVLLPTRQRLIL